MSPNPAGLYRCESSDHAHPYDNEIVVFLDGSYAWCEGAPMKWVRPLNRAEQKEAGQSSSPEVGERRTMPRGQRTPEPDEKVAARALLLLQDGSKRTAVAEETGLTIHQVWRIQRDNGLLKTREKKGE